MRTSLSSKSEYGIAYLYESVPQSCLQEVLSAVQACTRLGDKLLRRRVRIDTSGSSSHRRARAIRNVSMPVATSSISTDKPVNALLTSKLAGYMTLS